MNHHHNLSNEQLVVWAAQAVAAARAAGHRLYCPVCNEPTTGADRVGLYIPADSDGAPFAYSADGACAQILAGGFGESVRLRAQFLVDAAALERRGLPQVAAAFRDLADAMSCGEVAYEACAECGSTRTALVGPDGQGRWAFAGWVCAACEVQQ